jgi:hypothetical protein
MPKRIRNYPIYVAPGITGQRKNGIPLIYDERTDIHLNPNSIDDKIKIYERQVKFWFLEPANDLLTQNVNGFNNNSFVALMISLSYIEGVEQYRVGQSSDGQSRTFFRNSMQRLYPNIHNEPDLNALYNEARCGLFHTGMTEGRVLLGNDYENPISFPDPDTILINPQRLLDDIITDFENYLSELRNHNNREIRQNFDDMFNILE